MRHSMQMQELELELDGFAWIWNAPQSLNEISIKSMTSYNFK